MASILTNNWEIKIQHPHENCRVNWKTWFGSLAIKTENGHHWLDYVMLWVVSTNYETSSNEIAKANALIIFKCEAWNVSE